MTDSLRDRVINKRHWNTVTLDGSVPDDELLDLIGHSYELVVARLTRSEHRRIAGLRQRGIESRLAWPTWPGYRVIFHRADNC